MSRPSFSFNASCSASRSLPRRLLGVVVALAAVGTACSSSPSGDESGATGERAALVVNAGEARSFPPAPETPDGPLAAADVETIETMARFAESGFGGDVARQLLTNSDARNLWVVSDWIRFTQGSELGAAFLEVAETISGVDFDDTRPWGDLTDHLLAWDLPAPPDYRDYKAAIFTTVDERWRFVFDDADADIDYRLLSWGGVLIDDRPLGDPDRCARGCIPALDDPALTGADGGSWYPDTAIVFGVEIDGDAVALPRNIMEIHEMVNATIGGRRIAMPYCTLCGSAQVFFTDTVPQDVAGVERPPVLRTSGLLSRSNKVMYDLDSRSVFDTFSGKALSGPLREAGVMLEQASVVTATWGDWKAAHPDTRIVAEDGGIGRTYDLDPLSGRDDDGPIFPIGDVDPRLRVQEQVLGIELPSGGFAAVPVDAARATLQNGDPVEIDGVQVHLDADGLRATADNAPIATHQAFWFAWSQFHPDTALWLPTT